MKELSLNILDITQNSITAGAKNIGITIIENSAEAEMSVTISDDGCGMDERTLKNAIDPFYTSRTTRKVGLGLPLYKMSAEMTGGRFHIESEKGVGTTTVAVFKTDSIDFTPLGDIISTVCILISGSPEINFLFRHGSDEKSVVLDTRELKTALGEDISLAEPDVINWIKDYLTEQYAALD